MTTDADDRLATLISRLRAGDDSVLGELFSAYRDQLRRMVQFRMDRRVRGRVDASDILQEAYMDAAQHLQRFRDHPEMPFVVWVRLMTTQRLIDVHRKHLGAQMRDAGQEISIDRAPVHAATSACIAAHLVGDVPSPSQEAMREERLRRLEETLDRMDPVDREVLALRHFEELGNNEVAEILGLKKTAASNRYIRALKRLKDIVSHDQF